jgi:predicted AAA+ superfamily ATPase
MYARILEPPGHSFFLFGPRATGKTTWLRSHFPDASWHDLLKSEVFLALTRDPGLLRKRVGALPEKSWVVIDEVQRIPALLREVHALIAEHKDAHRFALSGSSARKLRRMDVDLLAGRVFDRRFFPLTFGELQGDAHVDHLMGFGCLPKVRSEPHNAVDILEAYAHTYLRQEIQQEALVKDLVSFDRFLEVAAIMNGQVVNAAGVSRDSGVSRTTVQRFFSVLVDTLVGDWVTAFNPRLKAKEVSKPKFYFFDPGVVRALSGLLRDPVEKAERGPLLETLVLHELRAHSAYAGIGGRIHFWRTPSGREVDFIWSRGRRHVGFEVKSAAGWRGRWGDPQKELVEKGVLQKAFGIYLGADELVDGPVRVLPFETFTRLLGRGELIP